MFFEHLIGLTNKAKVASKGFFAHKPTTIANLASAQRSVEEQGGNLKVQLHVREVIALSHYSLNRIERALNKVLPEIFRHASVLTSEELPEIRAERILDRIKAADLKVSQLLETLQKIVEISPETLIQLEGDIKGKRQNLRSRIGDCLNSVLMDVCSDRGFEHGVPKEVCLSKSAEENLDFLLKECERNSYRWHDSWANPLKELSVAVKEYQTLRMTAAHSATLRLVLRMLREVDQTIGKDNDAGTAQDDVCPAELNEQTSDFFSACVDKVPYLKWQLEHKQKILGSSVTLIQAFTRQGQSKLGEQVKALFWETALDKQGEQSTQRLADLNDTNCSLKERAGHIERYALRALLRFNDNGFGALIDSHGFLPVAVALRNEVEVGLATIVAASRSSPETKMQTDGLLSRLDLAIQYYLAELYKDDRNFSRVLVGNI